MAAKTGRAQPEFHPVLIQSAGVNQVLIMVVALSEWDFPSTPGRMPAAGRG
ncbi:MAG: hypothetical protein R2875_04140 [Desulfobacterales bacterium]